MFFDRVRLSTFAGRISIGHDSILFSNPVGILLDTCNDLGTSGVQRSGPRNAYGASAIIAKKTYVEKIDTLDVG